MCKSPKFYICKHCGNIVEKVHDSGVPVVCCGEQMSLLVGNTSDGVQEKHVPVVVVEGNKVEVSVGSVAHPMTEEHHIAWIYLETSHGGLHRKCLAAGQEPKATFMLNEGETAVAAYEYCNLHGLWKAEL